MTTYHLNKIFSPRSIAVIGASDRAGSVGNAVVRNLLDAGFLGNFYPVNPNLRTVAQRHCFAHVADVPGPVDLAIVCTPAEMVAEIVEQCGRAGVGGLIILSAGFREVGGVGIERERELAAVARTFPTMRIIGPNSLGILSPHHRLNASFAGDRSEPGTVAFISQSGAICSAILDWASTEKVGFSQFVSIGNMIDVSIADLIDYFDEDGHTTAIVLYVESLTQARAFLSAAGAFTRTKPIIAVKSGRFAESAEAAASHTGAMASVDGVYEAALVRAGVVRVGEIEDLFDAAELLTRHSKPRGDRLAIVTNSGGPGVMATDALLQRNGNLATPSDETMAALNANLPMPLPHRNPIDLSGDATPERFAHAVATVLRDTSVDAVLVILSPQPMTDPTGVAEALIAVAKHTSKPVLASWVGGKRVAKGIECLTGAGIPHYSTPEKCVRVYMHLVHYERNREMLYETPQDATVDFALNPDQRRAQISYVLSDVDSPASSSNDSKPYCDIIENADGRSQRILNECESKSLLGAYGIQVTPTEVAGSIDEAVAIADRMGYPVVLKVFAAEIIHKTDVGGVELNLKDADEVANAYDAILQRTKTCRPGIAIHGVTVQPMVTEPLSRELIVGVKRDPVFGPVLLAGAGGIATELDYDRSLELPPLNERLAMRMLESLRSWPLLSGYRGRRGVQIDRLVDCLLRVSQMVVECPEIVELDINPLLATERDAIALDARMKLVGAGISKPNSRYSHLAIRPYPHELIRSILLPGGNPVLLRPIRPEDEPRWHRLIQSCSPETIQMRFQYMFKSTTHAMASRFCFVDYDRELAIVAEVSENSEQQLAGVGRVVADAQHQRAEFAILVADRWQGQGLGGTLLDECLRICRSWGIQTVFAETAPSNHRMIQMFRRRGFVIDRPHSSDAVLVSLDVSAGVSVDQDNNSSK